MHLAGQYSGIIFLEFGGLNRNSGPNELFIFYLKSEWIVSLSYTRRSELVLGIGARTGAIVSFGLSGGRVLLPWMQRLRWILRPMLVRPARVFCLCLHVLHAAGLFVAFAPLRLPA